MEILVCIKPDMNGEEIGPFERLALEAGLLLKEASLALGFKTACVDVVTAGPLGFRNCLDRALGTGADQGIHLLTSFPDSSDPGFLVPAPVTAGMLARVVTERAYDLILTGVMSQDLMAGQTGPYMAEILGLPCATAVVHMELEPMQVDQPGRAEFILAKQEMEGGLEEDMKIELPALVSIQSGFYTPRYPVLSHMLKAREKPVTTIPVEEFPRVQEVFSPPVIPESSRQKQLVQGSLRDQIEAFTAFISERGLI